MLEFTQFSAGQLALEGKRKGMLRMEDGSRAFALLPRERAEPYSCRWLFNELIYCEIAEVTQTPVHAAGVFRVGDVTGLLRFPFGERLLGRGFPSDFAASLDPKPFESGGYNLDKFYDVPTPEQFREIIPSMRRILLLDQLLWMLDRTPDNMLGVRSPDGRYIKVRAIDHEHCLALGGDPKHPSNSAKLDLSRCHPTQMTHFVDLSLAGTAALLDGASELKNHVPVSTAQDIAERVRVFPLEEVGIESKADLNYHVKLTLEIYKQLWESFTRRMSDFADNFAPSLRRQGKTP